MAATLKKILPAKRVAATKPLKKIAPAPAPAAPPKPPLRKLTAADKAKAEADARRKAAQKADRDPTARAKPIQPPPLKKRLPPPVGFKSVKFPGLHKVTAEQAAATGHKLLKLVDDTPNTRSHYLIDFKAGKAHSIVTEWTGETAALTGVVGWSSCGACAANLNNCQCEKYVIPAYIRGWADNQKETRDASEQEAREQEPRTAEPAAAAKGRRVVHRQAKRRQRPGR